MTGQQRLVITRTLAVVVALLLTRGSADAQDATAPKRSPRTSPSSVSSSWSTSRSTRSTPRRHMPRRSPRRPRRSASSPARTSTPSATARSRTSCAACAGFYVTNDRNYSYLGMRGFSRPGDYNARILLLVDGHRMNDNVFGSALLGTEFAAGPRPHRADRDRPWPELVALRHERVLRGDQRHHQEGGGGRRLRCRRQSGQLRHQPRPCELRQGVRQRRAGPALGFRLRE